MRGVILAGGTGSRLFPLTKVTNKHLLPISKKPMIYYPIEKLISAGIDEILVVTGVEHMGDVVNLLGSGVGFNCRFTYKVQDQAGGIAQALGLARNFANNDSIAVILGDNLFQDDLTPYISNFVRQERGAKILLKEVQDPDRFGVAEIRDSKVVSIEEKPKRPKSNLAVTGIYMFDERVFDLIDTLKPSQRGELEITDVNNLYIQRHEMTYDILPGWWTDAGTFDSLSKATNLVETQPIKNSITSSGKEG